MSRTREPSQKVIFSSGGMTLPNIPRIAADEKSRQKYLSEYDKYEPELHRHHLGAADTTNTIGLKDVPAEFDRTVPSLSGPTEAELEYERAREHRKTHALRRGYRGGAAAADSETAAPVPRRSLAPPPQPQPLLEMGSEEPLPPLQRASPSASRPSSAAAVAAAAPAAEDSALPTTDDADATRAPAAAAAVVVVVDPAAPAPAAAPAPRPPSARGRPGPLADSTVAGSHPRAHTAPSLKVPPTANRLGQRTGPSSAAPTRVPRPRSRPPPQPVRFSAPAVVTPPTLRRPRTAMGTREAPTAESTARVLRVLLDPPQQFASSLRLNLSFCDLGWLRDGQPAPHHLTTVANYSGDDAASPHFRINSPRSVIALLENGVQPKDWNPNTAAASAAAALSALGTTTPDTAAVQAEVREHRRAHVQAQRDALRHTLQDTYALLCARAPLNEIVDWYRRLRQADMEVNVALEEEEQQSLATAVRLRQERQRRVFETNKLRMMRQVQQAKEMQERQDASDQRKVQAEAEAEEARQRKALEEQEGRRQQLARLEAHRAERQRREEAYREQLQARLSKAELRNVERAAARERQLRAVQEQREAQEAERLRRLARNTALLEEQAATQEQRRLEKDAKLEQLRVTREARLVEEHRVLVAKQQRAAQLREEARQRAVEAEEAVRQAAMQRQQHADERLREFHLRRQQEAAERAAVEAAHYDRIDEVRAQAFAKEEQFKATVEEKLQQHEDLYRQSRSRQVADIMWRREADWEAEESKAYAVLQMQRIVEFKKLHTVVELLEKRKVANAIVRQRELVCEQAMRDRDSLRLERDALKRRVTSSLL
ncbi:hypothetical protein NESM_000744600 [Novymonas esmeraldas]|uniref:Uncharacterized protein n=1 Tax=Novymonas esmeraldas TaxID=1808958 RepID=A0AAW0EWL1_9TRYP